MKFGFFITNQGILETAFAYETVSFKLQTNVKGYNWDGKLAVESSLVITPLWLFEHRSLKVENKKHCCAYQKS